MPELGPTPESDDCPVGGVPLAPGNPVVAPAAGEEVASALPQDDQLRPLGVPAAALLTAFAATALAGRHLSRAHGITVGVHALAGVAGLVLALVATWWVVRPTTRIACRGAVTAGCALASMGIAAVDFGMLAWLALAQGVAAKS
ncbi:hypothetical protein ABUW04_01920 [Streptacidiphilus sp. N1-10]|uniref:Uncharacterized protein n=1 Tax=Streptacidiphilus jeojiensis TaxID=3229225 RepID=A0ABV6XFH6_9ACTN